MSSDYLQLSYEHSQTPHKTEFMMKRSTMLLLEDAGACLVSMRQRTDSISGMVDAFFVCLHLLVRLLLRGTTFFFCPMITDVINAGHLIWYAAYKVACFVLDVAHIAERIPGIDTLLRRAPCMMQRPMLIR